MSIVTKGSPTEQFIQMRSKYFVDDLSQLDVAVLKPPNMGNKTQRLIFLNALKRFEQTKCSTGHSKTRFWFFAYQNYLNNMGFGELDEETDLNYTVSTHSTATLLNNIVFNLIVFRHSVKNFSHFY